MMSQYEIMNKAEEDRLRQMAQSQAAACRNMDPMQRIGYGALNMLMHAPAQVTGPYESQSMNRKLAAAKKFLASRG